MTVFCINEITHEEIDDIDYKVADTLTFEQVIFNVPSDCTNDLSLSAELDTSAALPSSIELVYLIGRDWLDVYTNDQTDVGTFNVVIRAVTTNGLISD